MKEYWKLHKASTLVLSITIIISILIGYIGCRLMPEEKAKSQVDTLKVYVPVIDKKADSLLQDLSIQLHEINGKIKTPKTARRWKKVKVKNDTIRIDASVHMSNNPSSN